MQEEYGRSICTDLSFDTTKVEGDDFVYGWDC